MARAGSRSGSCRPPACGGVRAVHGRGR
uniref:Uncharacterized protein n=1 Tax=Arundo donax TaxID=35708 RepID=A0A0A9FJM2_ARUDO